MKKPSNKPPPGKLTKIAKKHGSRVTARPVISSKKRPSESSLARAARARGLHNQRVPQNNKIADRLWDRSSRYQEDRANLRSTGRKMAGATKKSVKTKVRKSK